MGPQKLTPELVHVLGLPSRICDRVAAVARLAISAERSDSHRLSSMPPLS
jgi:hypothetical protein